MARDITTSNARLGTMSNDTARRVAQVIYFMQKYPQVVRWGLSGFGIFLFGRWLLNKERRGKIAETYGSTASKVGELTSQIQGTAAELTPRVVQSAKDTYESIADTYPDVRDKVLETGKKTARQIAEAYPDVRDKVLKAGKGVAKQAIETYPDVRDRVLTAGKGMAMQFGDTYPDVRKKVLKASKEVSKQFGDTYPDVRKKVLKASKKASKQFGDTYPDARDKVAEVAQKTASQLNDYAYKLSGGRIGTPPPSTRWRTILLSALGGVTAGLLLAAWWKREQLREIAQQTSPRVQEFTYQVKTQVQSTTDTLGKKAQDLQSKAQDTLSTMQSKAQDLQAKTLNTGNSLKEKAQNVNDKAKDTVQGASSAVKGEIRGMGEQKPETIESVSSPNAQGQTNGSKASTDFQFVGNMHTRIFHPINSENLPLEENRVYFSSEQDARDQGFRPAQG